MKPLLTPREAAELDRRTQDDGTPAETLMERAGAAVARACVDLMGGTYGRRVVVACGGGNNGGDGLVAARHLERAGARTTALLLGADRETREPSATMLGRLHRETDVRVRALDEATSSTDIDRADVVIDAIFGTGFHGVPDERSTQAIAALNRAAAPVVAVDIPSGVDGETGAVEGAAVDADVTVTFGAAKLGVALMPGASFAGVIRVVDIGFATLPPAAIGFTEPGDVASVLPERPVDGHKRRSGSLVVVAGSRTMTGAVHLVARAAGRAGAGYVVVAVPASILSVVQRELDETVFVALPETDEGAVALNAVDVVAERVEAANALAIGPGLGRSEETASFVRALVREVEVPAVIDADGLNAFAEDRAALADRKADAILTPHLGELARLLGRHPRDACTEARALAADANAVAVVKGTRSVIAAPDGAARVNATGSSALATAGTGDVLTGAVGGLLARGVGAFSAAWAGAYVHGLAGIVAAGRHGQGVLAGDVVEALPDAIARVEAGA
jgi:ADP-dependent NAD(P)H-hydrate dehydratase / NAD(P)H-hydrate epimerase